METAKQKRVLVIGINTLPEMTGIGRYTGEMISWLSEKGYFCTMISTFPYYPHWEVQSPYSGRFYKKEIVNDNLSIYRCPFYVPGEPSGLKRVVHEASFFFSAFFIIFKLLFRPAYDEIMCVAPPFHLGFLGLFYRFFKGGRLTYHIQDLQIEAARDLKVLKPDWIFTLLFSMEKLILKKADRVSTISRGMQKKMQHKTDAEILLLPNWSDTTHIFPLRNIAKLKTLWGFAPEDKHVLYSGSVGEKQGLEVILEIAAELKSQSQIKFVICGSGPYKAKLEGWARQENLSNVHFLPLQTNKIFNQFLNMADVHLVLQKADASDLVMPSKLTNILSAGALSIVTANPGTTLFEVINEFRMGIVIPPEDKLALKEAIVQACTLDFTTERKNARSYAKTFLDKENVLSRVFNS